MPFNALYTWAWAPRRGNGLRRGSFGGLALLAAYGEGSRRAALAAQQQVSLERRLESAASASAVRRYRQRLAQSRDTMAEPAVGRKREMAAVQEAFALREVAAAYERLLYGMHGTLRAVATAHGALARTELRPNSWPYSCSG